MVSSIDSLFTDGGQPNQGFIGIPDLFSSEEESKDKEVDKPEENRKVEDSDKSKSEVKAEKKTKTEETKEVKKETEVAQDTDDSESPGFIDMLSDLSEVNKDIQEGKYENIDELRAIADSLVKDGVIVPYEDNQDVKTYSSDEIKSLIKDNLEYIRKQVAAEAIEKFFDDLPYEVQDIILYYMGGGKDVKGMLREIFESKNVEEIDVSDDSGAEYIVRKYLKDVENMKDDEVEEELKAYKESNILKNRAAKYKDRLISIRNEEIEKKKKEQESVAEKKRKMYEEFVKNVNDQISKYQPFVADIPSDVIDSIRRGLINNDFDSVTGVKTNILGNLIEKHLITSPNIRLVAEAVYLLMDPENYKKNVYDRIRSQVLSEERSKLKESVSKSISPDTHVADEFNTSVRTKRGSSSRKLNIDTSAVERLKDAFKRSS